MKAIRRFRLFRRFRHLLLPGWWVRRDFTPALLRTIEAAITASEVRHRGELRFVLEANLSLPGLLRGQTARARATELFSHLRVWDTEHNNGVLIYLQLIDRQVEIVADRGIDAEVGPAFWSGVCQKMEAAFRQRRFEAGTLAALAEITAVLAQRFPAPSEPSNRANKPNELSDAPLLL